MGEWLGLPYGQIVGAAIHRREGGRLATQEDLSPCVARIAAGDADALGHLYDLTCRLTYSLALRVLRRHDEAEEVVLDVYAQVWRTAASFEPRRGSVVAWLTTIARSRALDRLRSRGTRPDLHDAGVAAIELDDVADCGEWGDRLEAFDARRRVTAMLQALAPAERRLIELAFYEGYTHGELANLLDLPLGTIKTRIRTTLLKMRRALAGHNAAETSAPQFALEYVSELRRCPS